MEEGLPELGWNESGHQPRRPLNEGMAQAAASATASNRKASTPNTRPDRVDEVPGDSAAERVLLGHGNYGNGGLRWGDGVPNAVSVEEQGEDGLADRRLGRPPWKVTPELEERLLGYLDQSPLEARVAAEHLDPGATGPAAGTRYERQAERQPRAQPSEGTPLPPGRPRPALRIPVRGRRQVLQEIERLVAAASADEEVLYVDEVNIHLNPRIGLMYTFQLHCS